MKKLIATMGIMALVGAVAVPAMSWGPGWGRGHHMLGPWGGSPDYGRGYYGNLTSEQQSSLAALERKFHAETGDLRDQIRTKSRELDLALAGSDPNLEEVQALQQELSDLRARLDEKTLAYELEAGRIVPGQRSGYGYGRGYGHHRMAPYGHGMGYGAGYCWN